MSTCKQVCKQPSSCGLRSTTLLGQVEMPRSASCASQLKTLYFKSYLHNDKLSIQSCKVSISISGWNNLIDNGLAMEKPVCRRVRTYWTLS